MTEHAGPSVEPGAIVPLPTGADAEACLAPIAGEPPIVRVVRALLGRVAAPRVAVVVAEPLLARVRDILGAAGLSEVAVLAGAGRTEAIRSCLEYLVRQPVSSVLLHDCRHPLAPGEVTDRVVAGLGAGHGIVVPVVPVTDSVKSVDERGVVVATVDRATLLTVQYPRGFAVATLRDLIARDAADELDVALAAGLPVATVDGHADAARFSLPDDAALLHAIIASRR